MSLKTQYHKQLHFYHGEHFDTQNIYTVEMTFVHTHPDWFLEYNRLQICYVGNNY